MAGEHTGDVDDFFAHYGIKGMKWGVRRKNPSANSSTPKEPASEDAVNAKSAKAKARTSGTDALSNKELQSLVTRMNLEQQYSKLNPTQVNPGKKFLADSISSMGKQVVGEIAKPYLKKGIEAAIKSAIKKK